MSANRPRCQICDQPLHKNGVHPTSGRTRWRCRNCGASTTRHRPDLQQAADFRLFIDWVSGKHSLTELAATCGVSRWTLARRFAMFWFVRPPKPAQTGEVYDQVMIDGTYFGRHECLLLARNHTHVLNWCWGKRETKHNYQRLLEPLTPPVMMITDGNNGALGAISVLMPETVIQRCLFHIRARITQLISLNPRTQAGQDLQRHARYLLKTDTLEQAQAWQIEFTRLFYKHSRWLQERTYRSQVTAAAVPKYVRRNQQSWFTHKHTRDAYYSVLKPLKQGHLFNYLDTTGVDPETAASTTNGVESINALIKLAARQHRGMPAEHRRTAVDWLMYLRTEFPADPVQIAKEQDYGRTAYQRALEASKQEAARAATQHTVEHFHDEAMIEEGLWVRKGRAGR